jgi:hypothetical protein
VYGYRLFYEDGREAGVAHYAARVGPGQTIWTGDGRQLRVMSVYAITNPDSPFSGLVSVRELYTGQ